MTGLVLTETLIGISRWIRLLFGREFPFDDLLALWDILLSEDPGLELVDLVCVAMLACTAHLYLYDCEC